MDVWHAASVKKAFGYCPGGRTSCLGDTAVARRVKGCDKFRGPLLEKNSSGIILSRKVGVQRDNSPLWGGGVSPIIHSYASAHSKLGNPETTGMSLLVSPALFCHILSGKSKGEPSGLHHHSYTQHSTLLTFLSGMMFLIYSNFFFPQLLTLMILIWLMKSISGILAMICTQNKRVSLRKQDIWAGVNVGWNIFLLWMTGSLVLVTACRHSSFIYNQESWIS